MAVAHGEKPQTEVGSFLHPVSVSCLLGVCVVGVDVTVIRRTEQVSEKDDVH